MKYIVKHIVFSIAWVVIFIAFILSYLWDGDKEANIREALKWPLDE